MSYPRSLSGRRRGITSHGNAAGLHRLLYREESIRLAAEAQQPDQAQPDQATAL